MNLTGIDVPIAQLRNAFAADLWPNVSKKIYYARASRNAPRDGDGIVPEIYEGGNDYRELFLDDNYNVQCFFDGTDSPVTGLDPGVQPVAEVSIYFAVNLQAIYPDENPRPTEKVLRDVLVLIWKQFPGLVITTDTVRGREALDGYNADLVLRKFPNMQPWHLFRIDTEMRVQYDCDVNIDVSFGGFDYPLPIILS